jgi:hypothetical protein
MGQSLGKKAVSIKLVRAGNGQPPGFLIALGRGLLHVVDAIPLGLGFLAPTSVRRSPTRSSPRLW